jgi:2-polyprenyl-6-methoxyphenol hydroxylase-like FAD-dependent oxidoreductase
MQMKHDVDVLICGAGAAGLTLALDLARRGIAFMLIEQSDTPFDGSRGKGLQPRTLEIFEDLGMLDRLAAHAGPYPPQREYRPDGSQVDGPVAEPCEPTPAEPYSTPLMAAQFVTEAMMRERLAESGHKVEFGMSLRRFIQDTEGVSTTVSGPTGEMIVRARYLIGTDGGRSTVRKFLGIGFPGQTLGVRAMVADVVLTGLDRDAWHRFNDGSMERQVSLCPLAGTEWFQVQAPIPFDSEPDLSAKGIAAMIAERTGHQDIGIHAVSWASAYEMNARLAERYRAGRVLLAGDAAHIHPPTGGQGLNTSIQDAYNLGWKLAAVLRGAGEWLLDSYEEERRPIAAAVLGMSTRLLEAAKRGNMERGREVRQLDLAYPDSSLALEYPERTGGLRAGDRAPDAVVRGAAGQDARLFTLFKGPHWTALGMDVAPATLHALRRPGLHVHCFGKQGDLVDVYGHFGTAYGLQPGETVLVRPDGYIGAIVASSGIERLGGYLDRVGLAAAAQRLSYNQDD